MTSEEERPEPYEGMWDFDGSCVPDPHRPYAGQQTFSLGCFQWVRKARGRGLKRGKVMWRAKGLCSEREKVFAAAQAYCDEKNAQEPA